MAPYPSADATTLLGFDMALAISESAINNQLQLLYKTPRTVLPLPKPGTVQPPTSYLIERHVDMRYRVVDKDGKIVKKKDGSERWSSDSVTGWIAPPTVAINSRKDMSATITLKFIANPDGDGDSMYRYWLGSGPDAEEVVEPINDWTISWDADLSYQEIQAIQEDIALPEDVKSVLDEYVHNEAYLVSSVFCVLQSAKLVNTFRGRDANGNDLASGQWTTGFVKCLADWFQFNKVSQGSPTPRNPFVLGYGIRQKLPPAAGVPLFIPRHFQFTTTPADDETQKAKSCLNFAIVTVDDRRVNLKDDGNAGNWRPPLVMQAGLNGDEADGVMVLSNGLFFRQYLEPYFIKPLQSLGFSQEVKSLATDIKNWSSTTAIFPNNPSYKKTENWSLNIPAHDIMRNGLAIQERAIWTGNQEFTLKWSSSRNPTQNAGNEVQSAGSIVIDAKAYAEYYAETNTRGGRDDLWADMVRVKFQAHLRLTFILQTTKDGGWSVVFDPSRSFAPTRNGAGRVDFTASAPPANADTGIWFWSSKAGYFGTFGGTGADDILNQMADWNSADIGSINEQLAKVYKELQTKIILPAGNVFEFKGFNVDALGNVFCPVTYSSISGGEQFTIGES